MRVPRHRALRRHGILLPSSRLLLRLQVRLILQVLFGCHTVAGHAWVAWHSLLALRYLVVCVILG